MNDVIGIFFLTYVVLGMFGPLTLARSAEKKGREPVAMDFVYGGGSELFFLVGLVSWPIWVALECFSHKAVENAEGKQRTDEIRRAEIQENERSREEELFGRVGDSVTTLRPHGMIQVDGERLEAKSISGYLPENTRVRVLAFDSGIAVAEKQAPTRMNEKAAQNLIPSHHGKR